MSSFIRKKILLEKKNTEKSKIEKVTEEQGSQGPQKPSSL